MSDAASPNASDTTPISPVRRVLRQVKNQFGRAKWDYPASYSGPRPVRITHLEKLHSTAFPRTVAPADSMWLDLPLESVRATDRYRNASDTQRDAIEHYHREGWWRVDSLFSAAELERVFDRYRQARDENRIVDGTMGRRHLNPQRFVPEINELFADRRLLDWVELFMGRAAVPFQTIVGEWGTEQEIHTDAIHQTTFPLGFHVSAWLACEDIVLDAGALFFYPRSHRLPYVLAADCGISDAMGDPGPQYRSKYVPHIERVVAEHGLERQHFLAKQGDVLIWHHNLLHGGSAILDPNRTRRAMALFFYGAGALHYHDLSGDRAASAVDA
jgi:hypothetical protein